jgi:hypothetical protein
MIPDADVYRPVNSQFYCPRRSKYHKSFYQNWAAAEWNQLVEYPYFYQEYLLQKLTAFIQASKRETFVTAFVAAPTPSVEELGQKLWPHRQLLLEDEHLEMLTGVVNSFVENPRYNPWSVLTPQLADRLQYMGDLAQLPASLSEINAQYMLVAPREISRYVTHSFLKHDVFEKRIAFYDYYIKQRVTLQFGTAVIHTQLATLCLLEIVTKSQWGGYKETERKRFSLMLDTILALGANPHEALTIFCTDEHYRWNPCGIHYLVSLGARLGEAFFGLIDTTQASAHEALDAYNQLESLLNSIEAKKAVD